MAARLRGLRETRLPGFLIPGLQGSGIVGAVERSLGFVAVQPRNGTITIPAQARRALRLDLPGAQVEVILRDHDLVLVPHVAVPLQQARDDGAAPSPG